MKYISLIIVAIILTCTACNKQKSKTEHKEVIYVRHAGADMPAYIYGNITDNTFLVILHGGPGGSGLEYRLGSYAKKLEEKYGVVYFDQRGQGMSQGSYSSEKNSPVEMAKDVNALALVLKKKYGSDAKLFLMGHSWGGTLGSTVVSNTEYQKQFKGWIEVDGAHNLPLLYRSALRLFDSVGTGQIALGNNTEYWKTTLAKTRALDSNKIDFGAINAEAYEAEAKLSEDNILATAEIGDASALGTLLYGNNLLTTWFSGTMTNLAVAKNDLDNYSVSDQLKNVKIPSLLLWGKYDLVVPPELGYDALNNIGSTEKELIIYEKSGHSPMNYEPVKFTQDIINFIEKYR